MDRRVVVLNRRFPRFDGTVEMASDTSLTKKAYLNAIASALDYGARLVVAFVIIPWLVKGLGDYGYGVWQVLGRLIGYANPASGRSTVALKWTVARSQTSVDYEDKRLQVGSAIVVWLLFLPLLTVVGGSLAWFAPIWLGAPQEFFWSIRVAAALLVANLIMTSLADVPRAVLAGENLGFKRMGLSTFLVFTGGGLTVLALYFDSGIVGVAAAHLVTTLLTGVLFLCMARGYIQWFGVARPTFERVRRFLGLSVWFLAWSVIMKLLQASDVVILGMFASPELVTVYSITKEVPEVVISVIAIVVFGILPGLGGIIGSGDLQKASRVRDEIMSFTWLIATVVGATTLLWNHSFVRLWVGVEYYAGATPTLLTILMVTQFVLIRNDANFIDLTLNLRRKVLMGLVSTALSLGIGGVLVGSLDAGINGVCIGFIAGRSILSLGYPWLVGRFLGIPLCSQVKGVLRPAFVTSLFFSCVLALSDYMNVSSWLGLVFSVGVTLGCASLLVFYTGLSPIQRRNMLRRCGHLMSPREAA